MLVMNLMTPKADERELLFNKPASAPLARFAKAQAQDLT
jgi:hypothetical protein